MSGRGVMNYRDRFDRARERAADAPCETCRHRMGDHRERHPLWTIEDGVPVETWPIDFRPGLFFCTEAACGCAVRMPEAVCGGVV